MQITVTKVKIQVDSKFDLILNSFCEWGSYQGSLCWRMGLPDIRNFKISTYNPEWGVTLEENPRLEKYP